MLFDAHWRMPRPLGRYGSSVFPIICNIDMALINYSRDPGILVEAYSPITHGEALKNPAIVEMAKKYGVSAALLCIRYVVQLGNRCVA